MNRRYVLCMTDVEVDRAVKLKGTQFDRKRKLTDKQVEKMQKLLRKGKDLEYIAQKFGIDKRTVRYNTDPEYRQSRIIYNSMYRSHTSITKEYTQDRIEYKRKLVSRGKIKI